MTTYINISTYKFAPLTGLKERRMELLNSCRDWDLRGTILLSTEGINLFVAGRAEAIEKLVGELKKIPGLSDLEPKVSESDHQPFSRMLVRIKREIIAFGIEGINPGRYTSPKISPEELKRWLDEGRKFTLLDTRNDYEIKLGTFTGAVPIGVRHFRDFPGAADELPASWKNEPVVTFCTGGIRCEKAAPYLESRGFGKVWQLDGGILKYFERCGNAHYEGDCFVFDKRIGVDPSLQETTSTQCYACLTPLSEEDQRHERYVAGESCHFCYRSSEEKMRTVIDERHRAIAEWASPLPGSEVHDHARPMKVPARDDGKRLLDFLDGILRHVGRETWMAAFRAGLILGPDRARATPETVVSAGERYFNVVRDQREPEVNADVRICYEDEALIVLEKPAPLPVHACGRFSRNTLRALLEKVYWPQKPLPAHRLDANTTGIMLVARTRHFAGLLQPQFSAGTVEKCYWARVYGSPEREEFECELPLGISTEDAGARRAARDGVAARTRFRVAKRFGDGTTLLEVWPLTGRTNQIRIHLWELGWPIVGEQLYLPEKKLGRVQTGAVEDAPLCLHAQKIAFTHPVTNERMIFESNSVTWA